MPSRRAVLAGLGGGSAVALAGCLGDAPSFQPGSDESTDWPMPRFDATNTAYSPDAAAPREGVRERWTVEAGAASGPPAVVDGTVFLPTAEALVALDAADGGELWRFAPGDRSPWPSGPVVHDGTVYVSTLVEDSVHAVDADSGEQLWSEAGAGTHHVAPHLLAGEHVSEPLLYVGGNDGVVRRLDPATGEEAWRTDLFGAVRAFGYRTPSLYVGTSGGEVFAFHEPGYADEPPGEGWHRKVGGAVETILPDEECVLVRSFGDPMQCLQDGAHAGTERWRVESKLANSAPVHTDYTFFTAGYDALAAFREYDRHERWTVTGRYDATDPVAAGDTLYASSGDAVHAFALDGGTGVGGFRVGAERWSHPTPGGAHEGLAVADGAVFAACEAIEEDATLYCLEPA